MIRALVVGRKRPGRPIPEAVAEVAQQLEEAGWEVVTSVVKRKRDVRRATRSAVKDERDVVVAVGGDGAVLQVATVLADTTVALGIIPTGTGNLLAGNLKIPTDRERAVEALLSGRPRRIDMGRVSIGRKKRAFTVACGIGYDAKVMDATTPEQKLHWGKLAYLANAVRHTGSIHNGKHEITIDGVRSTMDAAQVFIANFGKMLPMVQPRRRIRGDDGLLDVIVVRARRSDPDPARGLGGDAARRTSARARAGMSFGPRPARSASGRTRSAWSRPTAASPARRPSRCRSGPRALTVIVPRR